MRKQLIHILFVLLALVSHEITSQNNSRIPAPPREPRLVNVIGNNNITTTFLTSDEQIALEKKLQQFSRETSNQICIVIVDTLNGLAPSQFSAELGNEWGVGMSGTNNGIILLICPATRDMFIAPANRLQGAITDLRCNKIIKNILTPKFRKKKHFEGLNEATDVLMMLAKGEVNQADKRIGTKKNDWLIAAVVFILIFGGLFFFRAVSSAGGGILLGGGAYPRGGWGVGGGSSGGFGGFGGFGGGGGFNGGGAGGRW